MTWNFDYWKKRGIKGPEPYPLLGTFGDFFKKDGITLEIELVKQYGKVFGEFLGRSPQLMIADPALLREVLVKSSNNFLDRSQDTAGLIKEEYGARKMLSTLKQDEWKRVRNTLTPAFTASRFKLMVSRINECADLLVKNFSEKGGEDIKKSTDAFTFDVIARVGFGVELDTQKDPDNLFITNARGLLGSLKSWRDYLRIILFIVPGLFRLVKMFNPKLSVFPGNTSAFFLGLVEQVIEQRKKDNKAGHQDLIQLMLDAHNLEQNEHDEELQSSAISATPVTKKALTKEEVMGQSLLFFILGFESTSASICLLMYNLACNPDCQDKAREEVDRVLADNKVVTYEMSQQFPYLEMCISESLRIYPAASRTNRECSNAMTIGGVDIPAGVTVNVSIAYLHYDENVWPEPSKFIPERFTPEEKAKRESFNYMPFGKGPRNCIAMRLAQTEIRVAMAKILQKFIIKTCDKTQIPYQLKSGSFLGCKGPVILNLEPRV